MPFPVMSIVLLALGAFLVAAACSGNFRNSVLTTIRGGHPIPYQSERIITWISFWLGLGLISMVLGSVVFYAGMAGVLLLLVFRR